jgi:hypothetical protein
MKYKITAYKDPGDGRGTLQMSAEIEASHPKAALSHFVRRSLKSIKGSTLGRWSKQSGQITLTYERME